VDGDAAIADGEHRPVKGHLGVRFLYWVSGVSCRGPVVQARALAGRELCARL
jgi:hypothetical protein